LAHGSNHGRAFTGDASGKFLYPALHRAGFASQPDSYTRDDGLRLHDLYITASARCAPPGNKPLPAELDNCQPYLEREFRILQPRVIVVPGRIAFERVLKMFSIRDRRLKFGHDAHFRLPPNEIMSEPVWLLCSYHPSQQNTLTGKLTVKMFDAVWEKAKSMLKD
jgi:uracil-DNA glycosylase family 4